MTNYNFEELIDIKEFTALLDSFYNSTGIPNGLVDNDGKIITQSGWTTACNSFHRTHPISNYKCRKSNLRLISNLKDGEASYEKCDNGLVDYATPIVIEGQRVATLFLGQILFEKPNLEFFIKQAQTYGYDENKYLEEIKNVPVISQDKIEALLESFVLMVKMMAKVSLSKLKEQRLEKRLQASKEKRIEIKDILDFSPIGIGWSDEKGKVEYVNHEFIKLFGYTLDDIPDIFTWYEKAYPDKEYRESHINPWQKSVIEAKKLNKTPPSLESNVTCKNGSIKRVLFQVSWVGSRRLVSFNDITAQWNSEQRNIAHHTMLEMVAKDKNLNDILSSILLTIEKEESSSICSILLLNQETKKLHNCISDKLPDFYNEAIDGIQIGEGVGSCGTAAALAKRVIVEDINTHEYWKNYKELAQKAGLVSCWSEPIISSTNEVLGTFAIYHKKISKPTSKDIERISFAANLAAVAIENKNTKFELEKRAYYDYLTKLPNRRYFIEKAKEQLKHHEKFSQSISLIMFDIDHFKKINDTYGHDIGDKVLKYISDLSSSMLRDNDLIGRLGGEEFAILLPKTNLDIAIKVAQRIREVIEKATVTISNIEVVDFTASFGVAFNNRKLTIDELLKEADEALYEAKAAGRNKVIST